MDNCISTHAAHAAQPLLPTYAPANSSTSFCVVSYWSRHFSSRCRELSSKIWSQKSRRDELNGVPSYMVDAEAKAVVLDLINRDELNGVPDGRPVGHEIKDLKHMGKAVGWAALANLSTWLTFIMAPFVLKTQSGSVWLAFGAVYLLVTVSLKCMVARFVLPCVIHICGPLLAKIEIHAIAMVCVSFVHSSDIITNTAFVAKFSEQYPLVWMAWFLMSLQPVYAVCMTLPIGTIENWTNKPHLFPLHYTTCPAGEQTAVYETCWEKTQTHMGALIALADGARVYCVQLHAGRYMSEFHKTRQSCQPAVKALKQYWYHSMFFTIMESVVFLQIKIKAVSDTCNEDACNDLAVWGVVFGTLTGLMSLHHDASVMWKGYQDALTGNHNFWTKLDEEGRERKGLDAEKESLANAGWYLAVQILITGACAWSLCTSLMCLLYTIA